MFEALYLLTVHLLADFFLQTNIFGWGASWR